MLHSPHLTQKDALDQTSLLTRRDFLRTAGGTAAIASLGWRGALAANPYRRAVPVGVQLYCVRHLLEEDVPGTLEQIATLGYDGVEFAGYYDYAASELKAMLDGHGLKVAGAHVGMPALLGDELQRSIDFHGELGNQNLIVPAISEERWKSRETVLKTAEEMTAIQDALRPNGMRSGYHCHAYSFNQLLDGETVWDLLAQNTPEDFVMQLDTGHATNGGASVPEVIKGNPGRINSVHVKPFTVGAEDPYAPFIGDDSLPWEEIFELCESVGGVEWYVVEYEDESHPPLEALKANRERVKRFGR